MILPPWLQEEARRVLGQMTAPAAKQLAVELELGAGTRRELVTAVARTVAKQPAVRKVVDEIRDACEALAQAEHERQKGRR